jgi:hypothetical protein
MALHRCGIGVPQGGVAPLLFLFNVNDIPGGIKPTFHPFADNKRAFLTISSDADVSDLQSDLDKLALWETT